MIRAIKDYWAFTKWNYRCLVFLVMPAILFGMGVLCIYVEIPLASALILGYSYVVIADVILDYMLLGGFYGKNNSSLEFLQSSNRFGTMIRDVVVMDILRRLAMHTGIYILIAVCGMNNPEQKEWIEMFSFLPLLCFAVNQVTVFVTRHFKTWQHAYAFGAIAMLAVGVCLVPMTVQMETRAWLVQGVLLILAIVVGVVVVWYSMRKVRDSYYDK